MRNEKQIYLDAVVVAKIWLEQAMFRRAPQFEKDAFQRMLNYAIQNYESRFGSLKGGLK